MLLYNSFTCADFVSFEALRAIRCSLRMSQIAPMSVLRAANRLAVTLPALATVALALTAFVAANRQLAAGRQRAPLGPEGVNARQ